MGGGLRYIQRIISSKSKTGVCVFFCFLVGVLVVSACELHITAVAYYFFLLVGFGGSMLWRRDHLMRFFCFCVLAGTIGGYWSQKAASPGAYDISRHARSTVQFEALVGRDPDIRSGSVRYFLDVIAIKNADSELVRGWVYVKGGLYPRYRYGDTLQVHCRLEKPEPIADVVTGKIFRYDKYLAVQHVFVTCQKPSIQKIGEGGGFMVFRWLGRLKAQTTSQINRLWLEPLSGLMAGILYGERSGLDPLTELFTRAGVSHIVAVSGYNVTIIIVTLSAGLAQMAVSRKKIFWLLSVGIFLFVIFTGASGSVVRAGVMAELMLVANRLGRSRHMGIALMATATIMTLANPLILVWDVGFQLSFLSTVGIVYVTPLFDIYFRRISDVFGLKTSCISTLSAMTTTLPLLLYQFGQLSLVAPLVNVLILWTIPWLMFTGFVSIVISGIFFPIGNVFGFIPWLAMKYMLGVVTFFSEISFASVAWPVPWWCMLMTYVCMAGAIIHLSAKNIPTHV